MSILETFIVFFVGIIFGASISAAVFVYKFKKVSKEYEAALGNYVMSLGTYAKMFDEHVYWMNSIIAWIRTMVPEFEAQQPVPGHNDPYKPKGN